METRVQPKSISYFAFTATPKAKNLELFCRPGETGLPEPIHLYSMQEAIEEGFILDVLKNYTSTSSTSNLLTTAANTTTKRLKRAKL